MTILMTPKIRLHWPKTPGIGQGARLKPRRHEARAGRTRASGSVSLLFLVEDQTALLDCQLSILETMRMPKYLDLSRLRDLRFLASLSFCAPVDTVKSTAFEG